MEFKYYAAIQFKSPLHQFLLCWPISLSSLLCSSSAFSVWAHHFCWNICCDPYERTKTWSSPENRAEHTQLARLERAYLPYVNAMKWNEMSCTKLKRDGVGLSVLGYCRSTMLGSFNEDQLAMELLTAHSKLLKIRSVLSGDHTLTKLTASSF